MGNCYSAEAGSPGAKDRRPKAQASGDVPAGALSNIGGSGWVDETLAQMPLQVTVMDEAGETTLYDNQNCTWTMLDILGGDADALDEVLACIRSGQTWQATIEVQGGQDVVPALGPIHDLGSPPVIASQLHAAALLQTRMSQAEVFEQAMGFDSEVPGLHAAMAQPQQDGPSSMTAGVGRGCRTLSTWAVQGGGLMPALEGGARINRSRTSGRSSAASQPDLLALRGGMSSTPHRQGQEEPAAGEGRDDASSPKQSGATGQVQDWQVAVVRSDAPAASGGQSSREVQGTTHPDSAGSGNAEARESKGMLLNLRDPSTSVPLPLAQHSDEQGAARVQGPQGEAHGQPQGRSGAEPGSQVVEQQSQELSITGTGEPQLQRRISTLTLQPLLPAEGPWLMGPASPSSPSTPPSLAPCTAATPSGTQRQRTDGSGSLSVGLRAPSPNSEAAGDSPQADPRTPRTASLAPQPIATAGPSASTTAPRTASSGQTASTSSTTTTTTTTAAAAPRRRPPTASFSSVNLGQSMNQSARAGLNARLRNRHRTATLLNSLMATTEPPPPGTASATQPLLKRTPSQNGSASQLLPGGTSSGPGKRADSSSSQQLPHLQLQQQQQQQQQQRSTSSQGVGSPHTTTVPTASMSQGPQLLRWGSQKHAQHQGGANISCSNSPVSTPPASASQRHLPHIQEGAVVHSPVGDVPGSMGSGVGSPGSSQQQQPQGALKTAASMPSSSATLAPSSAQPSSSQVPSTVTLMDPTMSAGDVRQPLPSDQPAPNCSDPGLGGGASNTEGESLPAQPQAGTREQPLEGQQDTGAMAQGAARQEASQAAVTPRSATTAMPTPSVTFAAEPSASQDVGRLGVNMRARSLSPSNVLPLIMEAGAELTSTSDVHLSDMQLAMQSTEPRANSPIPQPLQQQQQQGAYQHLQHQHQQAGQRRRYSLETPSPRPPAADRGSVPAGVVGLLRGEVGRGLRTSSPQYLWPSYPSDTAPDVPSGTSERWTNADALAAHQQQQVMHAVQQLSTHPPAATRHVQVTVKRILNSKTRKWGLLVIQQDVSSNVTMEERLADLAESQLAMMSAIFPRHILEFLAAGGTGNLQAADVAHLAHSHKDVTLLFMDIVGFTTMCRTISPSQVMGFLHELFSAFDALCDVHGVSKVETAGDCYIVAGGIINVKRTGAPLAAGDQVQQGGWAARQTLMKSGAHAIASAPINALSRLPNSKSRRFSARQAFDSVDKSQRATASSAAHMAHMLAQSGSHAQSGGPVPGSPAIPSSPRFATLYPPQPSIVSSPPLPSDQPGGPLTDGSTSSRGILKGQAGVRQLFMQQPDAMWAHSMSGGSSLALATPPAAERRAASVTAATPGPPSCRSFVGGASHRGSKSMKETWGSRQQGHSQPRSQHQLQPLPAVAAANSSNSWSLSRPPSTLKHTTELPTVLSESQHSKGNPKQLTISGIVEGAAEGERDSSMGSRAASKAALASGEVAAQQPADGADWNEEHEVGAGGEAGEGFMEIMETHDPVESARRVMAFAKDMQRVASRVLMPDNGLPVRIRIGLHTGDCITGMIGSKVPKFGVFGDSMNTASRMESTCPVGRIQVSSTTHSLLHQDEDWEPTGGIEVKGKGCMNTYLWVPPPDHLTPTATAGPDLTSILSLTAVMAAGGSQAGAGGAAAAQVTFVPHLGRGSLPAQPTAGVSEGAAVGGVHHQVLGEPLTATHRSFQPLASSVNGGSLTGGHAAPASALTMTLPSETLVGFLPPPQPVASTVARRKTEGNMSSAHATAPPPVGAASEPAQRTSSTHQTVATGGGRSQESGVVVVDGRSQSSLFVHRQSSMVILPATVPGPPGSLDSQGVGMMVPRSGLALALHSTGGGGTTATCATGRAVAQAVSVLSSRHLHQHHQPSLQLPQGLSYQAAHPPGPGGVVPPGYTNGGPSFFTSFTAYQGSMARGLMLGGTSLPDSNGAAPAPEAGGLAGRGPTGSVGATSPPLPRPQRIGAPSGALATLSSSPPAYKQLHKGGDMEDAATVSAFSSNPSSWQKEEAGGDARRSSTTASAVDLPQPGIHKAAGAVSGGAASAPAGPGPAPLLGARPSALMMPVPAHGAHSKAGAGNNMLHEHSGGAGDGVGVRYASDAGVSGGSGSSSAVPSPPVSKRASATDAVVGPGRASGSDTALHPSSGHSVPLLRRADSSSGSPQRRKPPQRRKSRLGGSGTHFATARSVNGTSVSVGGQSAFLAATSPPPAAPPSPFSTVAASSNNIVRHRSQTFLTTGHTGTLSTAGSDSALVAALAPPSPAAHAGTQRHEAAGDMTLSTGGSSLPDTASTSRATPNTWGAPAGAAAGGGSAGGEQAGSTSGQRAGRGYQQWIPIMHMYDAPAGYSQHHLNTSALAPAPDAGLMIAQQQQQDQMYQSQHVSSALFLDHYQAQQQQDWPVHVSGSNALGRPGPAGTRRIVRSSVTMAVPHSGLHARF